MDNLLPKVGAQYLIDGASVEIIHMDEEIITLRHILHHSVLHYRYDLFISDLRNRNILQLASPPGSGSKALAFLFPDDPEVVKAKWKFHYVSEAFKAFGGMLPVEATRQLIKDIQGRLNDAHEPSYSALYQWMKIYKDNNFDQFSLLKNKSREPRGAQLEAEVFEIIDQYIKDYYLDKRCITQRRVFAYIDAHIISLNRNRSSYSSQLLTRPSISTVHRRIKKLCSHTVDLKRYGPDFAKKRHHYSQHRPEPVEVLSVAEIDCHRLDAVVYDEAGNELGKIAWLVVIFELKTRVVIGSELSLTSPSAEKSIRALKSALRMVPGEEYRRGKMLALLSDNGPEFKNQWFISAIDKLGIVEAFAPPKSPNSRAKGERFFKTFASWLHEQPGSTVSGEDYNPLKKVGFSIDSIRHYFEDWLENVYHALPHRTLNKPPMVAWEQAMKNHLPPEKFTDEALDALCRKVARSKITHGRVHFLCLSWTGPNLPEINAKLNGRKAICYYDPTDLGNIWVAHPDNPRQPVRAFATDPEYQNGLTLTEHNNLKERAKLDSIKYDMAEAHLALLRMRQETDKEYKLMQEKIKNKNKNKNTTKKNRKPSVKNTATDITITDIVSPPPPISNLPMDHL